MSSNVIIRRSKLHSRGLFALKSFKKGEVVYTYKKGKILTVHELARLPRATLRYVDRIGKNAYEIMEPPARFVNHSCEPNMREKNRTGYALRPISKGEEIMIDYNRLTFLEKPFVCRCQSINCRKIISGKQL